MRPQGGSGHSGGKSLGPWEGVVWEEGRAERRVGRQQGRCHLPEGDRVEGLGEGRPWEWEREGLARGREAAWPGSHAVPCSLSVASGRSLNRCEPQPMHMNLLAYEPARSPYWCRLLVQGCDSDERSLDGVGDGTLRGWQEVAVQSRVWVAEVGLGLKATSPPPGCI